LLPVTASISSRLPDYCHIRGANNMVQQKSSTTTETREMQAPNFSLATLDDDFLRFYWYNMPASARALIGKERPQTAWIFGAGASHHFDLNPFGVPVPLANGFFKAFHALPTSGGFNAHVGPLISFLEHYRRLLRLEVWMRAKICLIVT
jgi:hypothetical protein